MNIYIDAFILAMTPQIFFALIGGIIGIAIKSKVEEYGWIYTLFIALGSIIAVGATSEYLVSSRQLESIFFHALIGTLIGMVGASLLHALNMFAPKFANNLVNKAGEKVIEKIDDVIK